MRIIIIIFFIINVSSVVAQRPTGFPAKGNTLWEKMGYVQGDSALIGATRDTFNARFPATRIMRRTGTDTSEWFYTGQRWKKLLSEGDASSVNARRSVTKATLDSLQLVNDTTLNTATGKKFNYQLDTTGRRAYYEDKYIIGKTFSEIRKLRVPDTSYVFRVNIGGVIGDYKYDPSDVSTVDDTVITIVSTAGYRYKRYIPDGVYDPKWFGAKANNSFNDTRAVEDCIRAIAKYSNNKGGVIRLQGNYRFDAVNFPALYPSGLLTFEINGNVTLLNNHSWTLESYKNIVGVGAGEGTQFGYGTTASIIGSFTDTSIAAVRIIQGHNLISDITIEARNIGLFFDGTEDGWIPTANIDIVRVGVSIINPDTTTIAGILNKDCFWINFKDVNVGTSGGRDSSSSIKLVNTVDNGFAGHSYLINFEHLTTQGWPVRIIGGVDAGNSFDINFSDWVAEVPKECILFIDSRKGSIRFIDLYQVGGADGSAPLIKNVGNNTSAITIRKCNIPLGYYIHGDQIKNLTVDYMSFDTQTSNYYQQENQDFLENGNRAGGNIGLNVQRGWKEGIHTQLGYPQAFASSDAAFIAGFTLDGTQVTAGYKNYDGSNTAFRIKNDSTGAKSANVSRNIVLNTGDKIIIGMWIKTDTVPNCTINNYLSTGSAYVKWRESNSIAYARVEPYQLKTPRYDWTFMTFYGTVDSANNESVNVSTSFGFSGKGRVYVSRPYIYLIKKSDSVGDRQSIEYARELVNAIPNVPVGGRMLPLRTNLYIGNDDSTIFNLSTKKWYQNTLIPYTTADSQAVTTKKYVDAAIATSGGYWSASVANIYNNNAGSVGIGTSSPGASTKLNVAGMGLFTGGAFNPGDGTSAGVSVGYNTGSDYGFIQSVQTSVAFKKLAINPGGGAVGVGTISPDANLALSVTKSGSGATYQSQFENTTSTGMAGFKLNNSTDGWVIGFRTNPSKGYFEIEAGGSIQQRWYGKSYLTASDGLLGFSSESNYSTNGLGAMDAGIGRNAVGVVEINSGSLGTLRDLKVRNISLNVGSDATLDMHYRNSSGTFDRLAVGTTLQQLRVNSGATGYEWFTPSTATTIYTGDGTLSGDRIVTGGANGLTFTSTRTGTSSTVTVNNTSTGRGINVSSGAGIGVRSVGTTGIGLQGVSTDNYGLWGQSTNASGIYSISTNASAGQFTVNPSSTNTDQPILELYRVSQSAGADGISGSIPIRINNSAAAGTTVLANQFIFKLTTATSGAEVSQYIIKGINSGSPNTLATFDGNANATFGTTNSIVGTATNNNAVAGNIGETVESYTSTYTNYTTTATYQAIDSITLTAGDWDIDAFATFSSNSATITAAGNAIFVISTTRASASGALEGKNIAYVPQAALLGTSFESISIAPYRVSLSSTTIYYLNSQAAFTIGNPQVAGGLHGRRPR